MSAHLRRSAQRVASYAAGQGYFSSAQAESSLRDYGRYLDGGGRESFVALLQHRNLLAPSQVRVILTHSGIEVGSPPGACLPPEIRPLPESGRAARPRNSERRGAEAKGGLKIPGYEVLGRLGEGGMGVVYRARDADGRLVAIKQIRAGSVTEQARKRFDRERDVMRKLDDPRIVRILDAGMAEGGGFIAMELVEGGELSDLFEAQDGDRERLLAVVLDLSLAVGVAHKAGIIHRDLKPENVMIARDGGVRVMDFGLARDLNRETVLTQDAAVLGTPHYLAPEQAVGDREAMGPWTDVFALGVILYRALTGRLPFEAESQRVLWVKIASEQPMAPSELIADLPPALSRVCMKALEKEPRDRYPDATAFAVDLVRAMDGAALEADSLAERLRRRLRSPWVVLAFAACLLACLALPLALRSIRSAQEARTREHEARVSQAKLATAIEKLEQALGSPNQELVGECLSAAMTAERDLAAQLRARAKDDGALPWHRAMSRGLESGSYQGHLVRALIWRSKRRCQLGKTRGALADAEAALGRARRPEGRHGAVMAAAWAESQGGSTGKALERLEGAINAAKDGGAALLELRARIQEAAGHFGAAAQDMGRAAKLWGAGSAANYEQARLLALAGQGAASRALFKRLKQKHKGRPAYWFARALADAQGGDQESALRSLAKLRELDPGHGLGLRMRTELLIGLGRLAQARSELAPIVRANPRRLDSLLLLARVDYQEARLGPLRRHCQQILGLAKGRSEEVTARLLLARLDWCEGRRAAARRELKTILERHPGNPEARYLDSIFSRGSGRAAKARAAWQAVSPGDPRLLAKLSLAALHRRAFAQARAVAKRLPKSDEQRLMLLGQILLAEGKRRAAEPVLEQHARRLDRRYRHGHSFGARAFLALTQPGRFGRKQRLALARSAWMERPDDPWSLWLLSRATRAGTKLGSRNLAKRAVSLSPYHSLFVRHYYEVVGGRRLAPQDAPLMLTLSRGALSLEKRRVYVIRLRRQAIRSAIVSKDYAIAAADLKTLEEYVGARVFDLEEALARGKGEAARGTRLRAEGLRREAQVLSLRAQIIRTLSGLFGTDRESVRRLKLAEDLLTRGKTLAPDDPEMWDRRALSIRYTGNNFGSSLGIARSKLSSTRSFPFFLQLVHAGQFFVGSQSLEPLLQEGRRQYGSEEDWSRRGWGVNEAEMNFCRAAYRVHQMVFASSQESRRELAQKVLKAAEGCLACEPGATSVYLFRAVAWSALGYQAECEADLKAFGKRSPISVTFIRMVSRLVIGDLEGAMASVRKLLDLGYPKTSLKHQGLTKPLHEQPEWRRLFLGR